MPARSRRGIHQLASMVMGVLVLAAGCADDSVGPPGGGSHLLPGLEDALFIAASSPITPSQVNGEEYLFELGSLPMVRSGEFNDFDFVYESARGCDIDVEVLNYASGRWDRLASSQPGCPDAPRRHFRLFSERGFVAREYLDNLSRLTCRGYTTMNPSVAPQLRVLYLNPYYSALPFGLLDVKAYGGFTFDGQSIWLCGPSLYQLTPEGRLVREIRPPATRPYPTSFKAVAIAPGRIWASGGAGSANTDTVYAYASDGTQVCRFGVRNYSVPALAFVGSSLWVVGFDRVTSRYHILEVDPAASCSAREAQVVKEIPSPTATPLAIASDGSEIVVVGPGAEIYKIATSGTVLGWYRPDLAWISGLAWRDGVLWAVHSGPRGIHSESYFISRFRLL